MKVKITEIKDAGSLQKERLVLKVLRDTDIGGYLIVGSTIVDDDITNGVTDVFWFPDKKVAANDLVVLYTKRGQDNEKLLSGGNTTHFFYWGSEKTKWQFQNITPVLIESTDWQAYI